MLKSSLWDYSDAYILVKETLTLSKTSGAATALNNGDKKFS